MRRINWLGAATILVFIILWEALIEIDVLSFEFLPKPSEVAVGFWDLIRSGSLQKNVAHTLGVAVLGWCAATVIGILLGALLGTLKPFWLYTMASVESLRSLPVVAFVPIAVLILGFSIKMEVVVACYAALWPITINAYEGMRSVDSRLMEVGRVLDLRRSEMLWKLRFPAAVPFIMVGLRLGLSLSFILTLVAEMLGNPTGLGNALVKSEQALQPAEMFAYVVAIGVIGVVLNSCLVGISRITFRGQMSASGDT